MANKFFIFTVLVLLMNFISSIETRATDSNLESVEISQEKPQTSPFEAAIAAALSECDKLKNAIGVIKKSKNSYIPFQYKELNHTRIFPKSYSLFSRSVIPDHKYDILYVKANTTKKKYNIITIQKQKILLCECLELKDGIIEKNELSINITEKTQENLISVIKKYKSSNKLEEILSEHEIAIAYRSFDYEEYYSPSKKDDIFILYGLDSSIFGIIFGGDLLLKESPSCEIYSLFDLMWANFYSIKNEDIERNDALFTQFLDIAIKNINIKKSDGS